MILLRKILPLTFLIAIVAGLFLVPKLVKIKNIECASQFGPCPAKISDKLALFEGLSLRDAKKQVRDYLSAEEAIAEFSLRFKLPATISVTILEKKPRFAMRNSREELYATLDNEGEVLTIVNESSLPFIIISGRPPNLGEKVSDKILFALKIQERLFSSYQVRSGELTGETLSVNLLEGYTVLFPLEGDRDELLGALSLIIYELNRPSEDSRIVQGTIKTIDLRFKNPVLK